MQASLFDGRHPLQGLPDARCQVGLGDARRAAVGGDVRADAAQQAGFSVHVATITTRKITNEAQTTSFLEVLRCRVPYRRCVTPVTPDDGTRRWYPLEVTPWRSGTGGRSRR